jgi:hypothetical protein
MRSDPSVGLAGEGGCGSVGAGRNGQFEIGSAAAVDMNRYITGADGKFAFAPAGKGRDISARDSTDAFSAESRGESHRVHELEDKTPVRNYGHFQKFHTTDRFVC